MANKNSAGALLALLAAFGGQQTNTGRTNTPSMEEELERLKKNAVGFDFSKLTAFEAIEAMGILAKATGLIHELNIFFDKVKKAHAINTEGVDHED